MDGIIVSNRMPIVRRLSFLCSNYHRRRQTSRRMCAFFGLSSSRTSVHLRRIDAILKLIVPFDHVKIVEAVGDKLDVMYDSGVRTGSDVIKALALGAKVAYHTSLPNAALTNACFYPQLVFIGRPYIYGLAIGGQAGVKHVLGAILADLDLTLQLSGIPSVKSHDLGRDCIQSIPSSVGK